MFALIDDQQITKFFSGNKGVTLGDVQYPKSIFTLWSEAERNAIGIYEVTIDTTNKKDEAYYINTNVSYGVESNKAVGSYGIATPKRLNDEDAVDTDGNPILDDEGNQLINYGLKTEKKRIIKQQASKLLTDTDWYVIKATDVAEYSVPSAVSTFRTNVRQRSNEMETAIDNAADVDALAALYIYNEDGERPLGEFPVLEI